MARGETVKEMRARFVYETDRSSLVSLMACNKIVRDDFDKLVNTFPKNMRRAVRAAYDEFVQVAKKTEAFEKAEMRRKESEGKRTTAALLREEQIRFRDRVRFINDYHNTLVSEHAKERAANAKHLREMERDEQASQRRRAAAFKDMGQGYGRVGAREKAPWLSASGFAGLTSGGGFGGLSFSGAGAPWMMAGMGAATSGWRQAQQGMESDFAIHRMMTLVGGEERGKGFGLERMSMTAKQLARDLGISIPEAADAMREALTNAISAGQASQFVKMANSLAMLEGTDLTSSVQSLASIKNVYGMDEQQMKLVPDVLFAAVDKGNVKLQELAAQIGQVGGLTKEAGIGFRELMASLAAATIKGMPGDVAATSMRAVASAILNPSERVVKEQEKIGYVVTPELVRMKGLTQVLLELGEAIKREHSSWQLAFSEEIRARKILPYLIENEGAGVQKALQDQVDAAGRSVAANKEMMDTNLKSWERTKEEWSQIGQSLGSFFGAAGRGIAAAGAHSLTGLGHAREGLGMSVFGGESSVQSMRDENNRQNSQDQAQLERFARAQLGAREDQNDYTWDFANRKLVRKAGLAAPGPNDNLPDWMKKDSAFYGLDKAASADDKAKMDRDADERSAKAWGKAIEGVAKHYHKIVNDYLPVVEHAQNAAASAASFWANKLEKIDQLSTKTGESAFERRQAFQASLSGNTKTHDLMRTFSKTKRNNYLASIATDPDEMARYSEAAQKSFGSLAGEDLTSVAKHGFNRKQLDSYVRQQISLKGLKGKEAMDARRMMYDEAHGIERDVGKAYGQFQGVTGPDFKKGDFSKWYTERGEGMMDSNLSSMLGGAKSEAQNKYDVAIAAHAKFRDLATEIKAGWDDIEERVAKVKFDLTNLGENQDVKTFVQALSGIMGQIHGIGGKVEGLSPGSINNQALGFKPTGALESDLADPRFKAPGGKGMIVVQETNHNKVDAKVVMQFDPTGVDPQTIAKLVAAGLVPAVRTELDRGRSTLKSPK